jgi:alkaline phosphatase D
MSHPLDRRRLLQLALGAGAAPLFLRHALAADTPRFALGIASGHPRPDGMVLWTRLTGARLSDRVDVHWEIAHDESFKDIAARGVETAEAAWAHSVHAEPAGLAPDRWYWYRFSALGQQSPAGRTRTAPAADAQVAEFNFAITSCQRWDHGYFAAWQHMAAENVDLVMFLGDYIYEYPMIPGRVRWHEGGYVRTLDEYRARYAQYKSDPALQAAHAAAPWLYVWDDHEVENDYANDRGQTLVGAPFLAQRAAAYQAYWEHQPFPKATRPNGADMRIYARHDWGRLARIHAVDDRQYRDYQACLPAGRSGGSTTVLVKDCAALADPKRSLLGMAQERWLAEGWDLQRPWNLLAQQTLMARFTSRDPQAADSPGGSAWTDGWEGYPQARKRLLDTVAGRRVPGVVALGGDVHANYVADLKTDFDDPKSPAVASEFCGTSITSEGGSQERLSAALRFNPHIKHGRSDERGYVRFTLAPRQLQAQLRVLDDVRDPQSGIRSGARFVVDAARPGIQGA